MFIYLSIKRKKNYMNYTYTDVLHRAKNVNKNGITYISKLYHIIKKPKR